MPKGKTTEVVVDTGVADVERVEGAVRTAVPRGQGVGLAVGLTDEFKEVRMAVRRKK